MTTSETVDPFRATTDEFFEKTEPLFNWMVANGLFESKAWDLLIETRRAVAADMKLRADTKARNPELYRLLYER